MISAHSGFLMLMAGGLAMAAAAAGAADQPASRPAASTLVPVPPKMKPGPPPARTHAEIRQVLGEVKPVANPRELRVVLVAGPKDHGPGEHDYPEWQKAWQKLLAKATQVRVTTAWEKPGEEDLQTADVLVLFKHTAWPPELNEKMDAFLARGGGIVLLHFAVDCAGNPKAGEKNLGLYWAAGAKFRHGWLDLEFAEGKSDFLRGFAGRKLRLLDETYWSLTGSGADNEVLATGLEEDGKVRIPLLWNRQVGKGRVHVNILGHYNWTFNDPLFRILVLRGIAWAGGQPVDRLSELATADVAAKD